MADPTVTVDVGAIITASGVALGSVLAWVSTQRGKKTERAEKAIAEEVERREKTAAAAIQDREDEFGRLERENVRLNAQMDRMRDEHAEELARLHTEHGHREAQTKRWVEERIAQCRDEVTAVQSAREAEAAMYQRTISKCRQDYAELAATVRESWAGAAGVVEDREVVQAPLVSDSAAPTQET